MPRTDSSTGRDVEAKLTRKHAPWVVGAILPCGIAGPILLMLGLARTEAGTASLLLTLETVATAIIALFAFREHIGWRNARSRRPPARRMFTGAGTSGCKLATSTHQTIITGTATRAPGNEGGLRLGLLVHGGEIPCRPAGY